jgi:DNA-binding transcriptional MerR regulator
MDENFTETTNPIAARVPCDASTVRDYADAGWVECRRLANGTRLFKPSAAEQIRKLRAQRMAHRGNRRRIEATS